MIDPFEVGVEPSLDARLTEFGKKTLVEGYLVPGESYQSGFARAAKAFSAGDPALAQRLYHYASRGWFMFASPLLANGGTNRGLPISCFLNHVHDSIKGLTDNFVENAFLATRGGGIGTYWGGVRSVGEMTSRGVETPGVIPFLHCADSQILAYHQGSTRRGALAAYLDVSHPEVEDFIDMRKPKGDVHRENSNMHHGLCVTDDFMQAVLDEADWQLVDPHSGRVTKTLPAMQLWRHIIGTRAQTGEPYLFFKDTANRDLPERMKQYGLEISHTNLCTEIMLPTAPDYTAVCCLSSVNFARYDEWAPVQAQFVDDLVTMLDNTLDVFIENAPPEMANAVRSAVFERSIGLGAMGLFTYAQMRRILPTSADMRALNRKLFGDLKFYAVKASERLARERGECEATRGTGRRHAHLLAIAPNATSSIICGGVSAGIEPMPYNGYAQKTKAGTFEVRNPALAQLLDDYERDDDETWDSIFENDGSVQHLDFLSDFERDLFRTAPEIEQGVIVQLAIDRQPFICQGQSLNLYYAPDVDGNLDGRTMSEHHIAAWRGGLKSVYYVRTASVGKTSTGSRPERKVSCTDDVCTVCEG